MTAIRVMAGVLRDAEGRVLLAQRSTASDYAGLWEFPGGKCEPGESQLAALRRELREELGIEVDSAEPLTTIRHDDAQRSLRLDAWTITRWHGQPQGLDSQALAWVAVQELDAWAMPPADHPIVTALRLPAHYAITPEPGNDDGAFCAHLETLLASGVRLLQLRCKQRDDARLRPLATRCAALAERHGADLLLNGRAALATELGLGLHLPAALLRAWTASDVSALPEREPWLLRGADGRLAVLPHSPLELPLRRSRHQRGWLAASCHDTDELNMARRLGCDFVVLAPVLATPSHADAVPLGWSGFAALAADSTMPVYALGGMNADDEAPARALGARGVAGIRAFWPA